MTSSDPFELIAKINLDEAKRSRDAALSLRGYAYAAETMKTLRASMRKNALGWRRARAHIRRKPDVKVAVSAKLSTSLWDIGLSALGMDRRAA